MSHATRSRFRPTLDPLDRRCLMAAHVTANLSRGVLTILGTGAADAIDVTIQGPARGNRAGTVSIDGIPRTFRANQVKRINIVGGAGDDAITVEVRGRSAIPVRINGGLGNDVINGVPDVTPVAVTPAPIAVTPPASVSPPITTAPPASVSPPVAVTPPVAVSPPAAEVPIVALPAAERRIVDLVNVERQKAGLSPLAVDGPLGQAAQIQAGNMARLDIMAHDLPGTAQPSLIDRASAVGYRYANLGENIAFNYPNADAVVAGWMGSPGHRANILNPGFTEIGVAVASNIQGEPYYAQVFGRPA